MRSRRARTESSSSSTTWTAASSAEAALPSIGVPVLLLADPADQIVPIMTAQRLESELPDARLRLVEHAGHDLPRRAPGAVAEAIAEFLAPIDDAEPLDNLSRSG